jgi:hypothetical protein
MFPHQIWGILGGGGKVDFFAPDGLYIYKKSLGVFYKNRARGLGRAEGG